MVKKYIWWVIVAACMIMIFLFSNQPATESTDLSDGLLFEIISFFDINVSDDSLGFLSVFIRKAAHFSVFAFLGFAVYMLVITNFGQYGKRAFFTALIVCMLYAATDEVHQLFVAGRSGEIRDVLLDSSGAAFGIALTYVIRLISRRKKNG